jgi:hypothetical protein
MPHIPAVLKTPFIEIHYLEGRTQKQKEQLAKAITKAVSEIFKVSAERSNLDTVHRNANGPLCHGRHIDEQKMIPPIARNTHNSRT